MAPNQLSGAVLSGIPSFPALDEDIIEGSMASIAATRPKLHRTTGQLAHHWDSVPSKAETETFCRPSFRTSVAPVCFAWQPQHSHELSPA